MNRKQSTLFAVVLSGLIFLYCSTPEQHLPSVSLPLERYAQPTNVTCGPTSLRMVMNYYDKPVSQEEIMRHFTLYPGIGVLDPHMAMAAMDYGFKVKTISYNYRVIHPAWEKLPPDSLLAKLQAYLPQIKNYKDSVAAAGYIQYLKRGGRIEFQPLDRVLIVNYLKQGMPVIAALDMEYLYAGTIAWSAGKPEHATHFVVIHGYNAAKDEFEISDPWYEVIIPNENGHYFAPAARVLTAILLGFQVNDGDLIIVEKAGK